LKYLQIEKFNWVWWTIG